MTSGPMKSPPAGMAKLSETVYVVGKAKRERLYADSYSPGLPKWAGHQPGTWAGKSTCAL